MSKLFGGTITLISLALSILLRKNNRTALLPKVEKRIGPYLILSFKAAFLRNSQTS